MKPKKNKEILDCEKPKYRDLLKIQFMDNSVWGIFLRWLAKINKRKNLG